MTTYDVDWAQIAVNASLPPDGFQQPACEALLALEAALTALSVKVDGLNDRKVFSLRAEALKAAREHVSALPSEQENSRGYRDHAMRPPERIELELRTARYLMDG